MTEQSSIDMSAEPPRYRESFNKLKAELRAIPESQLLTLNVEPMVAVTTTLTSLPAIKAMRARLIAEFTKFDAESFDKLEEYAMALVADWSTRDTRADLRTGAGGSPFNRPPERRAGRRTGARGGRTAAPEQVGPLDRPAADVDVVHAVTQQEHRVIETVGDLLESWARRLIRQSPGTGDRRGSSRGFDEVLERFARDAVQGGGQADQAGAMPEMPEDRAAPVREGVLAGNFASAGNQANVACQNETCSAGN